MTLANISQDTFLAKWTIVYYLVLAGGTIVACLWLLRTSAQANAAPQCQTKCSSRQTHRAQDRTPSSRRGPRLRQVYPTSDGAERDDEPGPDIDIIAIHGLDTTSEKTWTWRRDGCKVNWLADPHMLPSRVKSVRIFTYDWPADLLQPSDLVQKTQGEFAILLFEEIRRQIQITGDPPTSEDRPILFIASCLGGIVLMKALVGAGQAYQSVRRATRGIVFLATPFRGTSFQDVAALAEPGLNAWAWIRGREVIKLLTAVKEPTLDLVQLVQDFTSLCRDKDYPCHVSTFYEKGKTSLPSKVFPWLPAWLRQAKLLVNESSATLDMFPQPLPLSRPHILMNKFGHSNCTDECKQDCTEGEDFGLVSGKILEMLEKIRSGSPLEQADAWIRTNHYSADRLKIERLSGNLLPLDQCYINLAIVEEPRKITQHAKEGLGEDMSPHTSPFTLTARLNVETPDENVQVELSSLFDPRKDSNGQTMQPRRILIRGRAGVGKTTLCKKMVDEFIRRSKDFRKWNELFDRVLWVPLRRLKEWQESQYDLEELFCREFFAQQDRETREILAREMRDALKSGRTLFILDGLDEIAQELAREGYKSEFFKDLLHQPNVIITSRPHVLLPANVSPPDLELETIGFYPDQVNAYLQATFADPQRVEDVQSYFQAHQLIQGLVRIPVQLDALCYTWDSFKGKAVPQTMTAIYKAIEESLWKKDVLRLGKRENGELVTKDDIKDEKMDQIENLVGDEIFLLEVLAFTGLCNDVINFGSEHREAISKEFKLPNKRIYWNRTLPHLSFLRTSDPLEENHSRDYHFLHLTFQEYFAARYFVRQWIAEQPLNCLELSKGECEEIEPVTLLQEHKYDPRCDIFWRFVAGLLDADKKALGFFQAIEKEPRDVLGPTHQRLVMHCLSEVERKETTLTELQTKLEKQLEQWLLFECNFTKNCHLACEMECPEQVLVHALQQASEDARVVLLGCLDSRALVPSNVIDVAVSWLEDCTSESLCRTILRILRYQHKALPGMVLQAIAARLEDKDKYVQMAAIQALQGQANLTDEMLRAIVVRLEDKDWYIQEVAIKALQSQSNLTDKMLQAIAVRLKNKDWYIRKAAIKALQGQTNLTYEMLQAIAARLKDNDWKVQETAIKALQGQANLAEEILIEMLQAIAALLEHKGWYAREAAIKALQDQANLTDEMLQAIAVRLEDTDKCVREAAIKALQGQANLTDKMLQAIAVRLEDEYWCVQQAAIKALQGQANLTEEMLQAIAARLEHDESGVTWAAAESLHANFGEKLLRAIVVRLEYEDQDVQEAVFKALLGQANLTEEILQVIAAWLEDEARDVRQAAIRMLRGCTNFTEKIVQAIAARLEHKDWYVRQAAIKALRGLANIAEKIVQAIAARLKDEDKNVRKAAIKALQGRANLTEEIVQAIAARLKDKDRGVQRAATEALVDQASLPLDVLSPYVKPFCTALLQKSFKEHLYLCASDSVFIGVDLRHVTLSCKQEQQPSAEIWDIRNYLGVPPATS